MGVAVSAVEKVNVSRGGGSFRLPRSNNGTRSVYHPTCCLRAVPILAAKFSDQGNCTIPPPFSLGVTPLSTADEWPSCAKEVSETRL